MRKENGIFLRQVHHKTVCLNVAKLFMWSGISQLNKCKIALTAVNTPLSHLLLLLTAKTYLKYCNEDQLQLA